MAQQDLHMSFKKRKTSDVDKPTPVDDHPVQPADVLIPPEVHGRYDHCFLPETCFGFVYR